MKSYFLKKIWNAFLLFFLLKKRIMEKEEDPVINFNFIFNKETIGGP